MKVTPTATLLVASALSGLIAASGLANTECYKYFYHKDKCVNYAQNATESCQAKTKTHHTTQSIKLYDERQLKAGQDHRLERRYDTTKSAGTCLQKHGKKNDDSWYRGVCLWSGSGGGKYQTGWVDKFNYRNCGKKVWLKRKNIDGFVYARVVGGCHLGTKEKDIGCFNMAIGKHTFEALNPTPAERDSEEISGLLWDFNVDTPDRASGAA
ncbi:hypothetical protein PtA15_5A714 [Puccinia triticina]|uniref:Secreted protein n=1 Tax=Puccinia triticina TaxID=208348 RepID=A0ABY7CKB2_9BASI|nr:uncharacterized protein PtA15_5A714 [Puccinia triticina]WAQ85140.1 hypothetical protein PtA15_5A714 [Puccinia triticina]WAR58480.1 hypothetical protein PtB15_5B714 [Puccinia triticina]